MANEITKVTDQNGVDHPFKDVSAQNGVIANTKLIKDTVGWSGKNKLPNHAVSTGNFTVNANKTVTVNGTFSAQAVLPIIDVTDDFSSKLPSGDYILVSGITNENVYMSIEGYNNNSWVKSIANTINGDRKPFTIDYNGYNKLYITLKVKTGTYSNVLVGPMIVDPSCLDFTYEPYFGSTAFPRSEQAMLGAENFFDYENVSKATSNVTYALITNGINVKSSSTEWASLSCFVPNKYKNKNTDFVCDLDWVSGHTQVNIYSNSTPATAGATLLANSSSLTADGKIKVSFNNGSDNYLIVRLFVSGGTAEVGEANFTNIMLKFPNFNDDFVPFAMTNRELTEKVTPEKFTLVPKTNDITIDYQANYKIGNIVLMNFRVVSTSDSIPSTGYQIAETLDSKYCPAVGGQDVMGIAGSTWDASKTCLAGFGRYGLVNLNGAEKNVYYFVNAAYVTD